MSIVLWVMVLIVEGGVTGRPVHHARRLSVHHVAHRRVGTVRPARTCGQWRKYYTLLRLDHCPLIGWAVLEKLVGSLRVASIRIRSRLRDRTMFRANVVKIVKKRSWQIRRRVRFGKFLFLRRLLRRVNIVLLKNYISERYIRQVQDRIELNFENTITDLNVFFVIFV